MYIAQTRTISGNFELLMHPDELPEFERELQSALRNLGFRRARVKYWTQYNIAYLVINGQPYGRYDFSRHTFVD